MNTLTIALKQVTHLLTLAVILAAPAQAAGPFDEPKRPPNSQYSGTLFKLSTNYPATAPPLSSSTPWQTAINNSQIDVGNAAAYADALKKAITTDMLVLLYDFDNWNASTSGWYNQPWLAPIRDGIHGTYQGSSFDKEMFPVSGLTNTMTTHVLVYYDQRAAASLGTVWGSTAMDPVPGLIGGGGQFAEGGLIVKPAFTTADTSIWPPMAGAMSWPLWTSPDGEAPTANFDAQFFQFDIIVKDSQSSPESQWVYMTLVYDKDAPGSHNWDKMVTLGVMWGNDPKINSPMNCNYLPLPSKPIDCPTLSETWINPAAPIYAKETLGWGGRLSGPNDGAVDINASVQLPNGTVVPYTGRYAMSSCMGCHGAGEFEMQSFLLPSPSVCKSDACRPKTACENPGCKPKSKRRRVVYYSPGTPDYMRWFQNRAGNVPQDPTAIPLDYGMNYAFKALPQWYKQTQQKTKLGVMKYIGSFNDYRGVSPEHLEGN